MNRKRLGAALAAMVMALELGCAAPRPAPEATQAPAWQDLRPRAVAARILQTRPLPEAADPAEPATLGDLARAAVYLRQKRSGRHFSSGLDGAAYLESAREAGVLPEALQGLRADSPVTREQTLAVLYRAAYAEGLEQLNEVEALPDYPEGSAHWAEAMCLYRAGILSGSDAYGTLGPEEEISRGELRELVTRLRQPEKRLHFDLERALRGQRLVYGVSGAGRELEAWRYGDGRNVLVLGFAIHGWEDNWDRDGMALVETAGLLRDRLERDYETLVEAGDWTVYVLPCMNPDGLLDGVTCNGPGRGTTHHYVDEVLTEGGIDMNRSFPYLFRSYYDDRNYNGPEPLQAPEAQALAAFAEDVMGEGNNVLIDVHGWYNQIIVSGGWYSPIHMAFREYFPGAEYTDLYGSRGYFSAWAAYELGYDGALFEFPYVSDLEQFHALGLDQAFVDAAAELLEHYGDE